MTECGFPLFPVEPCWLRLKAQCVLSIPLAPDPPLFRITELNGLRESVVNALPCTRNSLPVLSAWTVVLPTQVEAHVSRSRPSDVQVMSHIFFQRQLRSKRSNPGYTDVQRC